MNEPSALFKEVTTSIGLIAVLIAVAQFAIKLCQDAREQRRRQVQSAIDAIDKIFQSSRASTALSLVDYWSYRVTSPRVGEVWVSEAATLAALTIRRETQTEVQTYVRECFDDLFLGIEKVIALCDVSFLRWSDVSALIGYYVAILRSPAWVSTVSSYAKTYGCPRTASVLDDPSKYPVHVNLPPRDDAALMPRSPDTP